MTSRRELVQHLVDLLHRNFAPLTIRLTYDSPHRLSQITARPPLGKIIPPPRTRDAQCLDHSPCQSILAQLIHPVRPQRGLQRRLYRNDGLRIPADITAVGGKPSVDQVLDECLGLCRWKAGVGLERFGSLEEFDYPEERDGHYCSSSCCY